jgi:hypothetical protein
MRRPMREKSVSTLITSLLPSSTFLADDFFVDDTEELDAGPSDDPAFYHDDRLSATEASELEERARDFARASDRTRQYGGEEGSRHLRVPAHYDPNLWAVLVKVSVFLAVYVLSDAF